MRKRMVILLCCGMITAGLTASALAVNATLTQQDGRPMTGRIADRTGDQIQLLRGGVGMPIRIENIKSLSFDFNVDVRKLGELKAERAYEQMIAILEPALKPFAEFADIPSNLTPFQTLLMELYYTSGQFDAAALTAQNMARGSYSPDLQEKARIYQLLSLVESGQQDKADELAAEYGWDRAEDAETPARLYLAAKLLAAQEQYTEALLSAAKVIALNDHESDWMPPAELLCAELYLELGMHESAEEVIRQILLLYKNSDVADKAGQLKIRMDNQRAEQL